MHWIHTGRSTALSTDYFVDSKRKHYSFALCCEYLVTPATQHKDLIMYQELHVNISYVRHGLFVACLNNDAPIDTVVLYAMSWSAGATTLSKNMVSVAGNIVDLCVNEFCHVNVLHYMVTYHLCGKADWLNQMSKNMAQLSEHDCTRTRACLNCQTDCQCYHLYY